MDLTKYHNKGITGMVNLGNTCFLNSCMQVISHTYELNEFMNSEKHIPLLKKTLPDTTVFQEWNDLRKVMWSGNGVVSPKKFVHQIRTIAKKKDRDLFTGMAQNDMPEFLYFIIDCMHNSISRGVKMKITGKIMCDTDSNAVKCYEMLKTIYSKEYSEIMNLFYGIYISEIISKNGKKTYTCRPESFFVLNLPISDGESKMTTLYECFDLHTKPELLTGDNAWYNEKTNKKEDVIKQITFWNLPNIIVIVLKRFVDWRFKLNNLVDFPIEDLDLSKYVKGYNSKSYIYDLYGICNHGGGTSGGHYTSFVKNAQNKWYHYNDDQVDIVNDTSQLISSKAYCLFYRKKNNLV